MYTQVFCGLLLCRCRRFSHKIDAWMLYCYCYIVNWLQEWHRNDKRRCWSNIFSSSSYKPNRFILFPLLMHPYNHLYAEPYTIIAIYFKHPSPYTRILALTDSENRLQYIRFCYCFFYFARRCRRFWGVCVVVVGFGLAINCNETMDETNWNSLFVICRLFQALLKIYRNKIKHGIKNTHTHTQSPTATKSLANIFAADATQKFYLKRLVCSRQSMNDN